jgi:hypothetical protein
MPHIVLPSHNLYFEAFAAFIYELAVLAASSLLATQVLLLEENIEAIRFFFL